MTMKNKNFKTISVFMCFIMLTDLLFGQLGKTVNISLADLKSSSYTYIEEYATGQYAAPGICYFLKNYQLEGSPVVNTYNIILP